MLVEEFYDKVIENYIYAENYYIILIHASHDVPAMVWKCLMRRILYTNILCGICPVISRKHTYIQCRTNSIEDRIRDWFVEMPVQGFLFPAFNHRVSRYYTISVLFQET